MASTKKNVNQSSVPASNQPDAFLGSLGHYLNETKRLEAAYTSLSTQFNTLKAKWESSHQTLEHLVHYMADGLLFVEEDGTIALFNPAVESLTGLKKENVVGKSYGDLFSDSLFGFSMIQVLRSQKGHQRIYLTLENAREVEVSTSWIPKKGLLLILRDRTEEHRLQTSLHQSERLQELGQMAATLAHEIRNPLSGIDGFARLLQRDLPEPTHQRMIEAILQGTGSLNRLVTHVLAYSRPLKLHFAPTDLVQLIRDACTLLQASPAFPPVRFQTDCSSLHLSVDKEGIQSILLNLLRNGAEAGATELNVTLAKDGEMSFTDNGKGMQKEELKKIFTPFFTTKAAGTGLGLATSLSVIQAHGGSIEVHSQPGKGTTFTIKLQGNRCALNES